MSKVKGGMGAVVEFQPFDPSLPVLSPCSINLNVMKEGVTTYASSGDEKDGASKSPLTGSRETGDPMAMNRSRYVFRLL